MSKISIENLDWEKMGNLIPTIVQNYRTKDVLMLAYSNQKSLEKTLKTGLATYWSRSRKELWTKGKNSGNLQHLKEILYDCDEDALLFLVDPAGPACHTGNETCFYRQLSSSF